MDTPKLKHVVKPTFQSLKVKFFIIIIDPPRQKTILEKRKEKKILELGLI